MGDGVVMISGDCHIGNAQLDWEPWVDPRFRERSREQRDASDGFTAHLPIPPGGDVDDTMLEVLADIFPAEVFAQQLESRRSLSRSQHR